MDRREFLVGNFGAALLASLPAEALSQRSNPPASAARDAGQVRHLLPTVSDTRMLIKASFTRPLGAAPTLRIGATAVRGRMNDTAGECWQFYTGGLAPGRRYALSLTGANGRPLCQPWDLSTFPAPDARPDRFRVLFFTCAGGPENTGPEGHLPTAIRNRLPRRALSFQPQAAVANGDHVYWDLHQPRIPRERRNNTLLNSFNHSGLVFGDKNETVLKLAAAPQIVPVYGSDFRSTPVFFLQDDHDYFDNDEGTDEIVTFPPPWFQLQLARATQRMYYPEFLPDATRPAGLPWSSAGDRTSPVSESFGTLRFGRLAEILLYDVRRTMTLAGPSAVFIDPQVEQWLHARTASPDTTHLVHAPSNPPGWTAGKWGEWLPGRARRRCEADDRQTEAVLAGRLAEAARPLDRLGRRDEGTHPADGQRRSARDRDRKDAAFRPAQSRGQSDRGGALRADRHATGRLAVGVSRRGCDAAGASGRARRGQADRAARLHAGRFSAGPDCAAAVQMASENPAARGHRQPGAVSHHRTGKVARPSNKKPHRGREAVTIISSAL